MAARESGQQPARKVASPRKQAAKAAAGRKAAAQPPEVPDAAPVKAAGKARTRTATAGASARTSVKAKARTVANTDSVEMAVSNPPPLTVVDATEYANEPAPTMPPPPAAPVADPDDPEGVIHQTEVAFRGRMVLVKLPTTEQLTIYRRLSQKFIEIGNAAERPGAQPMEMEEAIKHYDRAVKLVTSVIVKDDDKEWLEDEMLEGRMELPDAIDLLKGAFDQLAQVNDKARNRAERRAAKSGKARLGD